MAKYSTGGSAGGGDGDACELCGEPADDLRDATVAGAELLVCGSCAPHDDSPSREESSTSDRDGSGPHTRSETSELWDRDSSRWEKEGTDYEADPLPYLVASYGRAVTEARQEAGLQREELADELGVDADDVLAVEQGRAARAGVGGSLIAKLEDRLDLSLTDE